MTSIEEHRAPVGGRAVMVISWVLIVIGLGGFIFQVMGRHPERAWQAYLINFLLWSSVAQGGLLFSMVTHITKARWSRCLQGVAESFVAFFPVSFVLFLLLFAGRRYLFLWLGQDLHGKEVWLNMPFLFSRDFIGLFVLYGLGLAYVYFALRIKFDKSRKSGRIRDFLCRRWDGLPQDTEALRSGMNVVGALYILAYALVLTLIAFDLVMSMEPHWYSTLFGPYSFVKAFYLGLGGLIILAAIIRLARGEASGITPSNFHDIGKLFFAFCLLWADFFYAQLLVIWYGNIPEETSYVISRTMILPWKYLAWAVFIVSFAIPFVVLLNKNVKMRPIVMIALCSTVLCGLWLEHLLLLGPALSPDVSILPLGFADGMITLGFLGLLALAVCFFLGIFPEFAGTKASVN